MRTEGEVQNILDKITERRESDGLARELELEEGLRFLDKEVRPILQEFNEHVLQGEGEIFVGAGDETEPFPKITLEWRPDGKEWSRLMMDGLRGARLTDVKAIVVYYATALVNHAHFEEGKRPKEPTLNILHHGRGRMLADSRKIFVDGPIKRKESKDGKLEGGEPYEKLESFVGDYYRRLRREDWLPVFVEEILRVYELGGTERYSSKYHPEALSIEELRQTAELVLHGDIKAHPERPKIGKSEDKEKITNTEGIKEHLSALLLKINTTVFNGEAGLSGWSRESESHKHTHSVTSGPPWEEIYYGERVDYECNIEADVIRFTLPDGRIIRFFIAEDRPSSPSLYIDRHDSDSEGRLCVYEMHQNRYHYKDNYHRVSKIIALSPAQLEAIVCRYLAQEASPLWNKS